MSDAPAKTATISGVEVFEACDVYGVPYTEQDLRDAARNFAEFGNVVEPPLVIGHEEDQPLAHGLTNTGTPASGWLKKLDFVMAPDRVGVVRPALVADVTDVHAGLADLINRKAYKKISAEMWRRPPEGAFSGRQEILDVLARRGMNPVSELQEAEEWATADMNRLKALNKEGKAPQVPSRDWLVDFRLRSKLGAMVRRVSALGGELPRRNRQHDIPEAVFSDRPPRGRDARTLADEPFEVFMDTAVADAPAAPTGAAARRARLMDSLSRLQLPDEAVQALDGLSHADLQSFVLSALETKAGIHDQGGTDTPDPAVEDTGTADAPTMISDILAIDPTQDQATLEAMPPDELTALWKQLKGDAMSHRTAIVKVAPSDAFAALRAELDDYKVRTIAEINAAAAKQKATLTAINASELEAKKAAIAESKLKELRQRGVVTHSDVDPGSPHYNLRKQLLNASTQKVVKFGDKEASEFDALIAHYDALPDNFAAGRRELIPDRDGGGELASVDAEVDAYVARRHPKLTA